MIDWRYSRPVHLVVAIPVSAYTAALALLYLDGPREPISVDLVLFPLLPAIVLTAVFLPFWLIGGTLGYFILKSRRLLGAVSYAAVGLAVGITTAGILVRDFSQWVPWYAVVGVVSGLAGYGALRLLAQPPTSTSLDATEKRSDGPLSRLRSIRSRAVALAIALGTVAVGAFVVYDALKNFIPAYDTLVVAQAPSIVMATDKFFLLSNGEVWLYPSRLSAQRKPPYPETSELGQVQLRASPRFGRHAFYNYKRRQSVRDIYEVSVGSRPIIRYEEVVAAKKESGYPSFFYFGIGLIGVGLLLAVRYMYARRSA